MRMADARTRARLGALMQRVLIVGGQPAANKSLGERLRDVGPCQIWSATVLADGLGLAGRIDPKLILVDQSSSLDAAEFVRSLRRGDLSCRQAPVILVSANATAAAIVAARDAGAHEFLRRPFTIEALARHLDAAAGRPRDWIEGMSYVGPDRRRFNTGDYSELLRRRVEYAARSDDARMVQALKIIEAAMLALETDPRQALRAMRAQADEIAGLAKAHADHALWTAAEKIGHALAVRDAPLGRAGAAMLIGPLLEQLGAVAPAAARRSAA